MATRCGPCVRGSLSTYSTGVSWPLDFFCNDTATTEIYALSLHDALPILLRGFPPATVLRGDAAAKRALWPVLRRLRRRSEEHTSELQSRRDLVCRLLLEKKNTHQQIVPKSSTTIPKSA